MQCGEPAPKASFARLAQLPAYPGAGSPDPTDAFPESDRIELAPGQHLDFHLRLPAQAELDAGLEGAAGGARVTLPCGGARVSTPLEDAPGARLRAPLASPSAAPPPSAPTCLRLANGGAQTLTFVDPRLLGVVTPVPPILDVFPPRTGRPNVLLYVIDTLRADRLSLYGYHRATSPELDQLAGRALVFDRAYAAGASTRLSLGALLASSPPSSVGTALADKDVVPVTLAEAFRAAGYQTAAFQANFTLLGALGFRRGFDHYARPFRERDGQREALFASELHLEVLAWLDRAGGQPFFVLVQTMDVHAPYAAPFPFAGRYASERSEAARQVAAQLGAVDLSGLASPDRYDEEVAYADHQLGVFLRALDARGLLDSTYVVITSDHGEPLGQRGHFMHGLSLYEELVHIPLVLHVPGGTAGRRIGAVVSLIDLGPTLIDLIGVEIPESFQGRSWLRPGEASRPPFAMGEVLPQQIGSSEVAASAFLREGRYKLHLDASGRRLFDLETDPGEERDLSAELPSWSRYLETRLATLRRRSTASTPAREALSEEERRELEDALRALGYLE